MLEALELAVAKTRLSSLNSIHSCGESLKVSHQFPLTTVGKGGSSPLLASRSEMLGRTRRMLRNWCNEGTSDRTIPGTTRQSLAHAIGRFRRNTFCFLRRHLRNQLRQLSVTKLTAPPPRTHLWHAETPFMVGGLLNASLPEERVI